MAIDWDVIRERGEQGLLTADEAGALTDLARGLVTDEQEEYGEWGGCPLCWKKSGHFDDCPIPVLEAASERADDP